jgi:hypothetical protein
MGQTLLLDDDILDYLKNHLDIKDYGKMTRVSVKHRKLFDLYQLLYSKCYDKLLYIKGTSVEMILNIIDGNIREKYGFKKNKRFINRLMKYERLIEIAINNNSYFIVEYLLDILYNTSKRKCENIKNTMGNLYDNENLYYRNLDMFCSTLTIITKYFTNDTDYYYNGCLELFYKLNISILLFIIVKKFSISSHITANASQSSVINLFAMQNKKVSEYLENINDERLYSNKKYFKKYYINYIIYLMNTLYIDIPATAATAATAATVNNPLHYIPSIDMIVL